MPFVKDKDGNDMYWLDLMLNGGLSIPDEIWPNGIEHPESTFIMLLEGAPGTGKTTFALELYINLMSNAQDEGQSQWTSVYYSLETPTSRLVESANSFGWDEQFYIAWEKWKNTEQTRCCLLCGRDNLVADEGVELRPHEYLEHLKLLWCNKFEMTDEGGTLRSTPDILELTVSMYCSNIAEKRAMWPRGQRSEIEDPRSNSMTWCRH
ncbi:MAG: ATPase domain-containing protein [Candidatus Hydrogenedentota bacterium]